MPFSRVTVEAESPGAGGPSNAARPSLSVAAADAFEVQPGNQLLDGLGLAQVRRQDLGAKFLGPVGGPAIAHARLPHFDRTDTGRNRPFWQMAIANHLAAALGIDAVPMLLDPLGDLRFDRLRQQLLSARPENINQDVRRSGQWYNTNLLGTVNHGGVLLCRVGTLR
jgi:hypothetical protein